MQKKSFDMIDVLKLTASAMIFIMHTAQLYAVPALGYIWEILSRWGVPFFFITSAFFLFSREKDGQLEDAVLRRYCHRIALLYAGWFVLNLPGTAAGFIGTHDIGNPAEWLLFCKNALLSSTFTGSWYLLSCLFSACLITVLGKRFSAKQTLLLTVSLQLLCILSAGYAGVLPVKAAAVLDFLCFPLNLFGGCFCFALGRIFAQNREKISGYRKTGVILAAAGCAAFFAEMAAVRRLGWYGSSDQGIFLIPWAAGIFLTAVTSRKHTEHAAMYRKISTIVYCGQGNVHAFCAVLRIVFGIDSPLILLLISVLFIGLIILLVLYAQKRGKPAWSSNLT